MQRLNGARRSHASGLWVLTLAALLVAGCAGGSLASGVPPSSGEETPLSTQLPSGKPGQMPPMRDPIEVTGVVEAGVENGCIVLRTDSTVYQLMSSVDPLIVPGARLRVLGWLRSDVMTTCQQGTPLQVLEVHAAE